MESKNDKNVFLNLSCYDINRPTTKAVISCKSNKSHNSGLGNLLFQIASGLSYAINNNATLYVPSLNTYFRVHGIKKEDSIFRNINTNLILLIY